jgi:outer membrane assembly lipoprotein YfiO
MNNKLKLPFLILLLFGTTLPLAANMLSREIADNKKKKKVKIKDREGNTITTMPYEKLKKNKNELLVQGDELTAIKYLEEMVKICPDHEEKQDVMLELAGLWYKHKEYAFAQRVYEDFEMLYPGSDYVGFSLARGIECAFNQLYSSDRDQSQTEQTLKLIDRFMERKDAFSDYVDQVVEIEKKCHARLFESEINIANFYLKGGNIKSAQQRIDTLQKRFEDERAVIEPAGLEFKIRLARETNDKADLKVQLAQLEKNTTTDQNIPKESASVS